MKSDFQGLLSQPKSLLLLPMIYVAWADGQLDEKEWSTIRLWASIWLSEAPGDWIASWTDPADPPSAEELALLLGELRVRSVQVADRDLSTLVDAGMELAKHTALMRGGSTVEWVEEEVAALREI